LIGFNALLQVYGKKRNLAKAQELLKQMEVMGVKPNSYSYEQLIKAANRTNNEDLQVLFAVLKWMLASGTKIDERELAHLFMAFRNTPNSQDIMRKIEVHLKENGYVPQAALETAIKDYKRRNKMS